MITGYLIGALIVLLFLWHVRNFEVRTWNRIQRERREEKR
jgi:hypothetical protein